MNSQMLEGGQKIQDTPQFRNALEERQRLIRKEYDEKMQEIEKERIQIEEDKQQVDRYKQLLLKQRDIMIALTSRLNERDETIIQLQEELDAYDRINRETEQYIELKNVRIEQLQQFIKNDCNTEVPPSKYYQEEYLIKHFASFNDRKYQPHQDWAGNAD
jgi:chromosome segregation ATPase